MLAFENYASLGNVFISQLEQQLGEADSGYAARILQSTFKLLRNHLTVGESLQLISCLPLAIKSLYVDGWQPHDYVIIRTLDDFTNEIALEEQKLGGRHYASHEEILDAVRAVLRTLKLYVSPATLDGVLETLPKSFRPLLRT